MADFELLVDSWKSLVCFFETARSSLEPIGTIHAIPEGDIRYKRIRDLSHLIMEVLQPFMSAETERAEKMLESDLHDAAMLGTNIFIQMDGVTVG